jgi:hypothetical protein
MRNLAEHGKSLFFFFQREKIKLGELSWHNILGFFCWGDASKYT